MKQSPLVLTVSDQKRSNKVNILTTNVGCDHSVRAEGPISPGQTDSARALTCPAFICTSVQVRTRQVSHPHRRKNTFMNTEVHESLSDSLYFDAYDSEMDLMLSVICIR